jgi:hypothetical protein
MSRVFGRCLMSSVSNGMDDRSCGSTDTDSGLLSEFGTPWLLELSIFSSF